jgi:hypothetical protein
MSLAMALCYYFFVMDFIRHLFFLSSKNLKNLKITTFRRMDLPSSLGKGGGGTPILLDPVDRSFPRLGRAILRNIVIFKGLRFLKTFLKTADG